MKGIEWISLTLETDHKKRIQIIPDGPLNSAQITRWLGFCLLESAEKFCQTNMAKDGRWPDKFLFEGLIKDKIKKKMLWCTTARLRQILTVVESLKRHATRLKYSTQALSSDTQLWYSAPIFSSDIQLWYPAHESSTQLRLSRSVECTGMHFQARIRADKRERTTKIHLTNVTAENDHL